MAELRLLPLDEVLGSEKIGRLGALLKEQGVGELPSGEDVIEFDDVLSDDQLQDFMDRLEAHDVACSIYLPIEFEGTIELGDQSVGSAHSLLEALEELREELNIDREADEDDEDDEDEDEDDEQDEEEDELELTEQQLAYAWKAFARAAAACVNRRIPLHVIQ